jgi:phage terminase large subunit-like protein
MTGGWNDESADLAALRALVAEKISDIRVQNRWSPLPHQVPPKGEDWLGWLLLGGRGSGKTAASSHYIVNHVNGPPCMPGPVPHWLGIIAPTLGDAATSCFAGPAGIRAIDPTASLKQKPGGLVIDWPNGTQAKLFGAREPDDVERLRSGGNTCLVWCEEMAAWRYMQEAWDQMRFGLRVGPHPRWIGSTTPKPRPLIKELFMGQKYRNVVVTHATMYDNPHLPEHIRTALEEAYGGSTLGSQELYGRLIEQDEAALWNREVIERNRLLVAPDLPKIVIGVDPSGGAGEQGIIAVGMDAKLEEGKTIKHGYVLDDRTVTMKPDGWGKAAVQAAIDWDADAIVVETNFGGDMAVSTIVTAAERMDAGAIPIRTVRASRGKIPRAQPVSVLTTQGRWHHVGRFPNLEDQMCTWTLESDYSPDRIDAMVWPAWYLKLVSTVFKTMGTFGGSAMTSRVLTRRRPA